MEYQILLNSVLISIIIVMLSIRFKKPLQPPICPMHEDVVEAVNRIEKAQSYLCGLLEQLLKKLGKHSLEPENLDDLPHTGEERHLKQS